MLVLLVLNDFTSSLIVLVRTDIGEEEVQQRFERAVRDIVEGFAQRNLSWTCGDIVEELYRRGLIQSVIPYEYVEVQC